MYTNKHTGVTPAHPTMTEHSLERFADLSYDPDTGAYQFYHDRESSGPLSQAVAHVTTLLCGDDPESDPPLSHSIDPDALDRLFGPGPSRYRRNDHLTFTHRDCIITVHRSGRIVAYPPSPKGRPSPEDR